MRLPLLIFLVSFAYYSILSSKIFTWVFVSGDSGDWLTLTNLWIVPQPLGSPLYILLIKFVSLFPGNDVINLTIFLSCLPSAVTVTVVYLITRQLTGRVSLSIISSAILLSSAVFLTQSTILEEYALTTMLMVIGLYFLLGEKRTTGFIFLGLASAVHIVVVVISFIIWLIYFIKKTGVKELLSLGTVWAAFGLLPYSLILVLMYLDTPRIYAGGLDWYHVKGYFIDVGSDIVGTISVFDFPSRLLDWFRIIIISLGLAVIPTLYFFQRPRMVNSFILLTPLGFAVWYYLTCLDPGTWTFLTLGFPSLAIMASVGLSKLNTLHMRLVVASCLVLLLVNGVVLNANQLAQAEPFATTYYQELEDLPDGSAITIGPGGFLMALMYKISEGKDLIPIVWNVTENGFKGYEDYMAFRWGIVGNSTTTLVENALSKNIEVYIAFHRTDKEEVQWFEISEIPGKKFVRRVTGVTQQ